MQRFWWSVSFWRQYTYILNVEINCFSVARSRRSKHQHDVAREILKFQNKTWEFRTTSCSVNSQSAYCKYIIWMYKKRCDTYRVKSNWFDLSSSDGWRYETVVSGLSPAPPPSPPQYCNTDRSKAVLLLWFLTVTCSCCPYLYFGSPITWTWVPYFN